MTLSVRLDPPPCCAEYVGGPIRPWIPQWWAEEGGRTITFGSDAHTTDWLAGNFYEAMAMAEHLGFQPDRRPEDFWSR